METEFWWIFDALVVIAAIFIIYSNAKRGVQKVLVMGIGYIIATLCAMFISVPASQVVYEKVALQSDLAAIQRANKKVRLVELISGVIDQQQFGFVADRTDVREILTGENNREFVHGLYQYVNKRYHAQVPMTEEQFTVVVQEAVVNYYGELLGEELPEYVRLNFTDKVTEDPALMPELVVRLFNAGPEEYIEETYSKQPTQRVLQVFVFLILFSVLMVITAIISATLENRLFFNNTYFADHLYGGLIGVIEAFSIILMLTMLVRMIVMLGGGDLLCFNEPTIRATRIFRFFYFNLT